MTPLRFSCSVLVPLVPLVPLVALVEWEGDGCQTARGLGPVASTPSTSKSTPHSPMVAMVALLREAVLQGNGEGLRLNQAGALHFVHFRTRSPQFFCNCDSSTIKSTTLEIMV